MITLALRALAASAALLAFSCSHAAVSYRMQFIAGDTTGLGWINDAGDVLIVGFGDRFCFDGVGGASLILPPPYDRSLGFFVDGLPWPGVNASCAVDVHRLNSARDMVGTSFRDGIRVPTFWRDGIAYDLRDPANAGLTFVPDPGVRHVAFHFASLDVVNLADFPFLQFADWDFIFPGSALTNAGGLLAFEINRDFRPTVILIPVPEPPLLALLVLGALVAARCCKRSKVDR